MCGGGIVQEKLVAVKPVVTAVSVVCWPTLKVGSGDGVSDVAVKSSVPPPHGTGPAAIGTARTKTRVSAPNSAKRGEAMMPSFGFFSFSWCGSAVDRHQYAEQLAVREARRADGDARFAASGCSFRRGHRFFRGVAPRLVDAGQRSSGRGRGARVQHAHLRQGVAPLN